MSCFSVLSLVGALRCLASGSYNSSYRWVDGDDPTDRLVRCKPRLARGPRGDLRNRAVEACRGEWIFSLDTDERCTAAVRDEILALLAAEQAHDAFLAAERYSRWIARARSVARMEPPSVSL